MKVKFGNCLDCPSGSAEKPLTAKRCNYHYWNYRASLKPVKIKDIGKPIAKVSEKRKIENREYTIKRLQFLAQPENQRCFIEGCGRKATTIEHRAGRGINFLNVETWAGCCLDHNLELERNPELSKKYQLSKITGKTKI